MQYAVAVAQSGSISKASAALFVAQPNLSRAIKELENELGITLFDRSAQGMKLTPEGEVYIGYAQKILTEIEEMKTHFHRGYVKKQRFSISVPRASYITDAFTEFSLSFGSEPIEIYYHETDSLTAVNNILHAGYHLGIIRYEKQFAHYFEILLGQQNLKGECVASFCPLLLMHRDSPLAQMEKIRTADLSACIEIAHADPLTPPLSLEEVREKECVQRRIYVFERGSQLELLGRNPQTFMWVSPIPGPILERYSLVQRPCVDNRRVYEDLFIHPKDYKLSRLDRRFIECLREAGRKYIPEQEAVYPD